MGQNRPASGGRAGINWTFIVCVTGIFTLLAAYTQTHRTEVLEAAQMAGRLPDSIIRLLLHLPASIARGLPDIATVGALILVSGGVGHAAARGINRFAPFSIDMLSRTEQITIYTLTGMGLTAIGGLALGMIGLFNPLALWLFLAVCAVLTGHSLLSRGKLALSPANFKQWTAIDIATAAIVALFLAFMLPQTLSPPVAWDALTYHLVAPQRYLSEGRIAVQPDNPYLGFSQAIETLYGVVISPFGRDTAAALLHGAMGTMGLAALAALVSRTAGRTAARTAVLLLAGSYSIWALHGVPYVDLVLFALAVGMMSVLVAWREQGEDGWLVLLGALGGVALGVKYSSGLFLVATLITALWWSPRQFIRTGLLVGLPAALLFAPWMLRGLLLWHNPVYPFVFGGVSWDTMRSASLSTSGLGMIYRGEVWQVPLLPLAATIFGMDGVFEFDFTVGPLLLIAPVLLLVSRRTIPERGRTLTQAALILAAVMTAAWMVMAATTRIGAQTRLVIMVLPAFATAGGVAIGALNATPRNRPVFRAAVMGVAVGVLLSLLLVNAHTATSPANDYVTGGDRDAYLDARLGSYRAAMRRLGDLPDGSRVLMLLDPRGYYCPPHLVCSADLIFDLWGRPVKQGASPDAVMTGFAENYDYVLLNLPALTEWKVNFDEFGTENTRLPAALDAWTTPVWSVGETYTLYAWTERP